MIFDTLKQLRGKNSPIIFNLDTVKTHFLSLYIQNTAKFESEKQIFLRLWQKHFPEFNLYNNFTLWFFANKW